MKYAVQKKDGAWRLFHVIYGVPHQIATYPTRKAALLTARLLAGPYGEITELIK